MGWVEKENWRGAPIFIDNSSISAKIGPISGVHELARYVQFLVARYEVLKKDRIRMVRILSVISPCRRLVRTNLCVFFDKKTIHNRADYR